MKPTEGWAFNVRGALLLLFFALLISLITSLLVTHSPDDWMMLFGLHAVFSFWVCVGLIACWWLYDRLEFRVSQPALLVAVLLIVPLLVLLMSLLVLRMQFVLPESPGSWWLVRNLLSGLVVAILLVFYIAVQQQWRAQVAAETRARLDALQARITPHFLFNALNTISSLIHEQPDKAEQATMDLADLLRTGLRESPLHSLGDELELIRGYLRIESLRLGERLQVDWELPDDLPLEMELPALLIQPLVENAVIHGIARLPEGGVLSIRADRPRKKRLRFLIENPVPGAEDKPAPGNRIALDNIRQRLELAWEEGARLKTRCEGARFQVELIIPG